MNWLARILGGFGLAAVGTGGLAAERTQEPLTALVPGEAVIALEIRRPAALLDPLLSPGFAAQVTNLPAFRNPTTASKTVEVATLIRFIESTVNRDWQTILRQTTAGGLVFAMGPSGQRLLIVRGEDPALLQRMHDTAVQVARGEAAKQGRADPVSSTEYRGVTGWTFDGREAHAFDADRALFASDADVLKACIDLKQPGTRPSLAAQTAFQEAGRAVGPNAAAFLYMDLGRLRRVPGFSQVLDAPRQNPMAALLLADWAASVRDASWVAVGLEVLPGALRLRTHLEPHPAAGKEFDFARVPESGGGLGDSLTVPRQVAGLTLYRDLASFYGSKDVLFPDRTSGLIFFENMMGIFFSGRNLTDEVLAELHPEVRLVVARQAFEPEIGTPDPQLPAFALVLQLRNPARFGEVLEEAWQKALGLVNFTRGQKAQPGLILDRPRHGDLPYTISYFSAKEAKDRSHLDARFNYRPSLAIAGGYAILSSTDQLARDLVDAVARPQTPAGPGDEGSHSRLEVNGGELRTLLEANRSSLVRGNMVKEGNSQAAAESAIDTLLALVGWIEKAKLTSSNSPDGVADLTVTFR